MAPLVIPKVGIVLLFVVIFFVSSPLQPAVAFNVIDHAMCSGVTLATTTAEPLRAASVNCTQRTNEFLSTDEFTYLITGTTDESDVGAKPDLKFYDPNGQSLPSFSEFSPLFGSLDVKGAGRIAIWLGFSILKPNVLNGTVNVSSGITLSVSLGIVDFSGETIQVTSQFCRGSSCSHSFEPGGFSTYKNTFNMTKRGAGGAAALMRFGDWRAEFTLNGQTVVTDHFTLGKTTTTPSATSTAIGSLLIGGLLALVVIVALVFVVRSRRRTTVEAAAHTQEETFLKYCSNCGHPLAPEDAFCQNCGTRANTH